VIQLKCIKNVELSQLFDKDFVQVQVGSFQVRVSEYFLRNLCTDRCSRRM